MLESALRLIRSIGKDAQNKAAVLNYGLRYMEDPENRPKIKVRKDQAIKFYALEYGVAGRALPEKRVAVGAVRNYVVIRPVFDGRWSNIRKAALRMYIINAAQKSFNRKIKRDLERAGKSDEQLENPSAVVNHDNKVSVGEFRRWRAVKRAGFRTHIEMLNSLLRGIGADGGVSDMLRTAENRRYSRRISALRRVRFNERYSATTSEVKGGVTGRFVRYSGISPRRILKRARTVAERATSKISGKALLGLLRSRRAFVGFLRRSANARMRRVYDALVALTPVDRMRSSDKWGARKRQIRRILKFERPYRGFRRSSPDRSLRHHGYTLVLSRG